MADSYDIPATPKMPKKLTASYATEAHPVMSGDYGLTDLERHEGLHQLCEGFLGERNYRELAEVASLAHRYQQLAHIIYRVDEVIKHGPRRRRR